MPWQDRAHFFAVAASQMRRILVDHARARASAKRGGQARRLTLDEEDPRKSRVVELHFFGGLTYEEIAEVLGVSLSTVRFDMRFAKAWLRKEFTKGPPGTVEA